VARKQFSEADLELLVSLASVAALRIRNAALAEEAAERRRLEEELALARRIQENLLPQTLPEFPGYELFGNNFPSRGVSGDYYMLSDRNDGRECVVVVADVVGKGMPASLLTASLEALAAGPIEVGGYPDDICAKVSRRLYKRTPPEKYATAFVAILDTHEHAVRYANAGHNPGLLIRADGSCRELKSTGMPVGLMDEAEYTEVTVPLEPGDLLAIYTDGIVEAFDPDGEQYELDRMRDVLVRERNRALGELAERLADDLAAFVRGVPYGDDRTLVFIRRTAG
jgi:serine phosphatase RsbU (regulator of sigma subunit)